MKGFGGFWGTSGSLFEGCQMGTIDLGIKSGASQSLEI